MASNKTRRCSYCGEEYTSKDISNGVLIFKGSSDKDKIDDDYVRICSNCIKACQEIYDEYSLKNSKKKEEINLEKLTPMTIKKHLDKWVIEQERAKTDISTEIYNHFKRIKRLEENPKANENLRIEKSNIILIGPTGVGKTELVRSLSAFLDLPYVVEDSTSFTSVGYIGRDADEILKDLFNAAGQDLEKAQKGIVFLDEFDKLKKGYTKNSQKDIGGESVQQSLLKIIEGGKFDVKKDKMGTSTFKFDTTNVLFILGGAFVGLEEIVDKRLKKKKNSQPTIGFGSKVVSREPIKYNDISNEICQEDLKEFGIIPEVLGRCPVITVFNELSEETLIKILTEPKHAIIKQYQELFKMDSVDLQFSEESLRQIAKKAKERKIGARALRSILEDVLKNTMYEIPGMTNIKSVFVNTDENNEIVCEYEYNIASEIIE